jgi:hypothetical protein
VIYGEEDIFYLIPGYCNHCYRPYFLSIYGIHSRIACIENAWGQGGGCIFKAIF